MNEELERLRAEVNNTKCCVTCRWCYRDNLNDTICVNSDSEMCADWVESYYVCRHWEGKESKKWI